MYQSDLVMDPFIFPVPYHVSQYQPNGEQVFKTPIHNQVHHTIPNTYTLFLHCFCISIINTPQC